MVPLKSFGPKVNLVRWLETKRYLTHYDKLMALAELSVKQVQFENPWTQCIGMPYAADHDYHHYKFTEILESLVFGLSFGTSNLIEKA